MDRLTQRAALGQIFAVGTYYNVRNDSFIPAGFLKSELPSDAINITGIHNMDVKVGYEDAYEKQFELMDIGAGLGIRVLAGLAPLKGSSIYLSERPSGRTLHAALHHTITTTKETLNFGFAALKDCLAFSEISNSEATHVVAVIERGARSIISAREHLGRTSKVEVAKNQFQSEVVKFLSSVETLKTFEHHNFDPQALKQTQASKEIIAYSDILDQDGILMEDFQEAFEFLQLMPLHIKNENDGKGLPIMYSLLPIEMLNFVLPALKISRSGTFVPPVPDCSSRFIQLFSEFQTCRRTLDALERNMLTSGQYLPPNSPQLVRERQRRCEGTLDTIKFYLAQNLQTVRSGSDPGILLQLLNEYQQGESSARELSNIGTSFWKPIEFISRAVSRNAVYIGYNGLNLDQVLPKHSDSEAYVLFFNPSAMNDNSLPENQKLLFELLQNRDPKSLIAIVDCEATSILLDKARIARYQGGQETTSDFLEYRQFVAGKCFAECNEQTLETENIQKPIQRRHVTIPCPGPKCTVTKVREWICPRCMAPIEYGFSDRYIYCDCGRSLFSNYVFKCSNDLHGPPYLPYDPKQLLSLLQGLLQSNYLNILILGETGVGKSTFINALVNYLEFETLDEAISAEKLNYVIPCSFSTQIIDRTDPNRPIEEKRIKIGARDDEKDGSTGDSATQQTTVYPVTFNMGDSTLTVRLIDTPGMGDTRGVDADRQNMADILSTLSGYDELHGILILLKSNAARLTITFSYCIKELLTHLHHNAAKNIAFGFTNTRISNYTPGDTYGPLKTLLQQDPDIGLELLTPTTYCFDSESFRYLAAYKSGVPMPNKLDFDRSWKNSRDESIQLISHFRTNPPHKVKNTLTLNGARQLISELTKPMAEISQIIQTNIALTEDKMQELQSTRLGGDQLRNRLHVQKVQINAVPLDKPRTVCGNANCVEIKSDNKAQNNTVIVYKGHCHPVCYLSDVQADQIAHPGLIRCAAFDGSVNCQECSHHWQEHLHVLYELTEETVTVVDGAIQQELQNHANDVTLRVTALTQYETRIGEYKQEREIIRDAAAKFGVFLRKYSLAPYNDALIAYLDFLIKEEQMKVQVGGGSKRLLSLTEERHKHTEAIEVITRNMNSKANWNNLVLNESSINGMVQQLYGLKHFGMTLKNMKQGIATAHQGTYREIPYTVRRKNHQNYHQQRNVQRQNSTQIGPRRAAVVATRQSRALVSTKPALTKSNPSLLSSIFRF